VRSGSSLSGLRIEKVYLAPLSTQLREGFPSTGDFTEGFLICCVMLENVLYKGNGNSPLLQL
jgi:hypothetical protein